MPSHDIDEFLSSVVKHIKFFPDRAKIKIELENHIFDKMNHYIEKGHDAKAAEKLAIAHMGEAGEIGKLLNKQHNPVIGWLCFLTSMVLPIVIAYNVFLAGLFTLLPLSWNNPIDDIPKDRIVYSIKVNKSVQIDDRIITFSKVVLEKNRNLSISYEYHNKWFTNSGWSLGNIGEIKDNLGNTYFIGHGSSSRGFITKGFKSVENFNMAADMLIINYDSYNRKYRVEIPLKEGTAQ